MPVMSRKNINICKDRIRIAIKKLNESEDVKMLYVKHELENALEMFP